MENLKLSNDLSNNDLSNNDLSNNDLSNNDLSNNEVSFLNENNLMKDYFYDLLLNIKVSTSVLLRS